MLKNRSNQKTLHASDRSLIRFVHEAVFFVRSPNNKGLFYYREDQQRADCLFLPEKSTAKTLFYIKKTPVGINFFSCIKTYFFLLIFTQRKRRIEGRRREISPLRTLFLRLLRVETCFFFFFFTQRKQESKVDEERCFSHGRCADSL